MYKSINVVSHDLLQQQMGSIRKIHFVGIGGVGMCGIAEVLFNLGYQISGSDIGDSKVIEHLQALGVTIFNEHHEDNIKHADVIVVSSAIALDNPEIVAARVKLIPIISRAQMLGEIMRFRYGIAVAGTHGKTTTTSIISCILTADELDPTYVIGGKINGGQHAYLGTGKYMVVEADESDVSFLHLKPMLSVITNIDEDHMENYDGSYAKLKDSFLKFLDLLPFYGVAVLCIEDAAVREILAKVPCRTMTYGFQRDADLCAIDIEYIEGQTTFTLLQKGAKSENLAINLPGKHNVLNALAAIGISLQCGVSIDAIKRGLAEFNGVKRRFDIKGNIQVDQQQAILLDDYGHHPTEIAANIDAIKTAWPSKKIVMIFQPHRYTRLRALFDDFIKVLSIVDTLILLPVYSAGEQEIVGFDSIALNQQLLIQGVDTKVISIQDLPNILSANVRDGDVVVTQGAGSIGKIANELASKLL